MPSAKLSLEYPDLAPCRNTCLLSLPNLNLCFPQAITPPKLSSLLPFDILNELLPAPIKSVVPESRPPEANVEAQGQLYGQSLLAAALSQGLLANGTTAQPSSSSSNPSSGERSSGKLQPLTIGDIQSKVSSSSAAGRNAALPKVVALQLAQSMTLTYSNVTRRLNGTVDRMRNDSMPFDSLQKTGGGVTGSMPNSSQWVWPVSPINDSLSLADVLPVSKSSFNSSSSMVGANADLQQHNAADSNFSTSTDSSSSNTTDASWGLDNHKHTQNLTYVPVNSSSSTAQPGRAGGSSGGAQRMHGKHQPPLQTTSISGGSQQLQKLPGSVSGGAVLEGPVLTAASNQQLQNNTGPSSGSSSDAGEKLARVAAPAAASLPGTAVYGKSRLNITGGRPVITLAEVTAG